MRTVAILQARLGSTRLPWKVLLPLAGKPMVQNIIERVQRARNLYQVVLAYPWVDHSRLFTIVQECGCGYLDYRDNENDLIGRYRKAAEMYSADLIVRIPCDNPCVDPDYIDKAIEDYQNGACTFYSNTSDLVQGQWFDGIGAEVLSISRLKWLDHITRTHKDFQDPSFREHPHKFFGYTDSAYILRGLDERTIRLDVNTQADYDFIKDVYDHFGHNRFSTADVLNYLTTKETTHGIQREERTSRI